MSAVCLLLLVCLPVVASDYQVMVARVSPMVECTVGDVYDVSTRSSTGERFAGYEIDLMASILDSLGPAERFYFECAHFDDALAALQTGQAFAVFGGVAWTSTLETFQLEFSRPTLATGVQIVSLGDEEINIWSWIGIFTPELWACAAANVLGVGFVIKLLESREGKSNFSGSAGYMAAIWHSSSASFHNGYLRIHSTGGRIILIMFYFVYFILTVSFTADLIARLGASEITPAVSGFSDLDGQTVGIDFSNSGIGESHGATEILFDQHDHINEMISQLKDGTLDALLLDTPIAQYQAARSCDLYLSGHPANQRNYGLVYQDQLHKDLRNKIDVELKRAFENTWALKLQQRYFREHDDNCIGHSRGEPYEIAHMAGLIAAVAMIFGMAIFAYFILYVHKCLQNKRRKSYQSKDQDLEIQHTEQSDVSAYTIDWSNDKDSSATDEREESSEDALHLQFITVRSSLEELIAAIQLKKRSATQRTTRQLSVGSPDAP